IRMTGVNRAMENSDVAFCPRIDSIRLCYQEKVDRRGLAASNRHWPFYDLHDLINDGDLFVEENAASLDWSRSESMPGQLRDVPLCVITNFKLNILASLGHAVRLQQAVMEEVAATIRSTCLELVNMGAREPDHSAEPLLSPGDITSVKCCLLES